jgi:PAS domain S-box-containing protein
MLEASARLRLKAGQDAGLDRLLKLLSKALSVPRVAVELHEADRSWFEQTLGLEAEAVDGDAWTLRASAPLTTASGAVRGLLSALATEPSERSDLSELVELAAAQLASHFQARARERAGRSAEAAPSSPPNDERAELAASNARLRAVFDAMEEGVVLHDQSGAIIKSNSAARRILQLDRATLELQTAHGPPLARLVRRDGTPMTDDERPAAHVLRTAESVTGRVMGLAWPGRSTTWLSINATALRATADAPPHGAVVTFRDITEEIVLQEALARSLGDFGTLVAKLPVGIALSHGRTMRYVNHALVKMLGYDEASELEGRQTTDVIHPRSEQALSDRYAGMTSGQHPGPGILECRKRDGSPVLVEVTSMPSAFEGEPAILAIIRDVTEAEQARAERDAVHAALLQSLSQKETLLKEVHHRVKNNLQVIASLLRLGRGYVQDRASLGIFDDSIARLHSIALIHEQLYQSADLGKIEMSRYLRDLVTELVRANATQRRVTAQVDADPIFLNVDRSVPLGLIVNELVNNALKHGFRSPGATPPRLQVRLTESAAGYELVVADNGAGIDPARARDNSLGLRLVGSLAKQLGGTHHFAQGDGTSCHVVFPKRLGGAADV